MQSIEQEQIKIQQSRAVVHGHNLDILLATNAVDDPVPLEPNLPKVIFLELRHHGAGKGKALQPFYPGKDLPNESLCGSGGIPGDELAYGVQVIQGLR